MTNVRAAALPSAAGDFLAFAFENDREAGLSIRTGDHQDTSFAEENRLQLVSGCGFVVSQKRPQHARCRG
jgi:hypothetical protein